MTALQGFKLSDIKLGTTGGWLLATWEGLRVSVRIDTICQLMDIGEDPSTGKNQGCAISVTTDARHVNVDQTANQVLEAILGGQP